MKNIDNDTVQTQVYLSKTQLSALKALAVASGVSESELIRQAVDLRLGTAEMSGNWKAPLRKLCGAWQTDDDAERRMQEIRSEFDR